MKLCVCVAVSFAVWLAAGPAFAADDRAVVFAHMVNWHSNTSKENSIAEHTTETPCRTSLNPVGIPCDPGGASLGYDSFDPAIIEAQNEDFLTYGITPLVSWWGQNARAGDAYLEQYLALPSPVQIGVLYEATGLLVQESDGRFLFDASLNGIENRARFVRDIDHLQSTYFANPEYTNRFFHMPGERPVLFVWVGALFGRGFETLSADLHARIPIYFVGSGVSPYLPGSLAVDRGFAQAVRGFDAVSAYGNYVPELARKYNGHLSLPHVAELLGGFSRWSKWLAEQAPGVKFWPPMMFSFKSKDIGANVPLTATEAEARDFSLAVRTYIEGAYARCTNVDPYVMFASWNEHYEGSSLEPTTEYRDTFAKALVDTFKNGPPLPAGCRP